MPKCKNDSTRYYKGTEPSPLGRGYSARKCALNTRKYGLDKKLYTVQKVGKILKWVKQTKKPTKKTKKTTKKPTKGKKPTKRKKTTKGKKPIKRKLSIKTTKIKHLKGGSKNFVQNKIPEIQQNYTLSLRLKNTLNDFTRKNMEDQDILNEIDRYIKSFTMMVQNTKDRKQLDLVDTVLKEYEALKFMLLDPGSVSSVEPKTPRMITLYLYQSQGYPITILYEPSENVVDTLARYPKLKNATQIVLDGYPIWKKNSRNAKIANMNWEYLITIVTGNDPPPKRYPNASYGLDRLVVRFN
jgi:hypothetical protein